MQPRTYPAQRAGRGVERGPQRVRFRTSAVGAVCLSCCTPPRHQCSEQLLQPCAQGRRRKPGAEPALASPRQCACTKCASMSSLGSDAETICIQPRSKQA